MDKRATIVFPKQEIKKIFGLDLEIGDKFKIPPCLEVEIDREMILDRNWNIVYFNKDIDGIWGPFKDKKGNFEAVRLQVSLNTWELIKSCMDLKKKRGEEGG